MKTPQVTRIIRSEIDGQNRQFIWSLFEDGSAMSREIKRHCGDAAMRTKETWRETHPTGSEMAEMIAKMPVLRK